MDAFSEVLSGIKLKGALFFSAEFSAPWAFAAPPSADLAPSLSPDAHLIIYHFVVQGTARAALQDGTALPLDPGDIVVFPHGDPHVLSCGASGSTIDETSLLAKIACRDLTPMKTGGGGQATRFVCGFMACDPILCAPILEGLPRMFKVNVRTDRAGHWLENSLLHLVDEAASNAPGSEAILAKLSEALFVDTLRRHVTSRPARQTGWLAGAVDPIVGRSLALLHARPAHPWSIAELSEAVGLSRSSLVERFSRYLGEPPMAYLARWRMRLAAQALGSTSRGIAQIAADVGYESEAAFNRAFKRALGEPPAAYRRLHRQRNMPRTRRSTPATRS